MKEELRSLEAAPPHSSAPTSRASCRLCAGSARMQANAPALTAIISSRATRKVPAVAANTNALMPRDAPSAG